jgi:carotenoid cleavage dioxygenase-like enzyme
VDPQATQPLRLSCQAFGESIVWHGDQPTKILVFALNSTDPDTPPVRQYTAPAQFMFHHVNAYEVPAPRAGQLPTLVLDAPSYNDTGIFQGHNAFGVLDVMLDPARRSQIVRPEMRRVSIDLNQPDGTQFVFTPYPIVDQRGESTTLELPRINEARAGRHYCFQYGMTHDFRVVKQNMCSAPGSAAALSWGETNHYATEPLFFARPGASAEDDGVVVATVLDGAQQSSYLVVLDARTMTVLAKTYTKKRVVPFSLHGQRF